MFRIKRVYDEPADDDGLRILVDRLWPRGKTKEAAALDGWPKELTPSNELRKWFHAGGDREEFVRRYRDELTTDAAQSAMEEIRLAAADGTVTLLTGNKDMSWNHATVLRDVLENVP